MIAVNISSTKAGRKKMYFSVLSRTTFNKLKQNKEFTERSGKTGEKFSSKEPRGVPSLLFIRVRALLVLDGQSHYRRRPFGAKFQLEGPASPSAVADT